VLVSFSDMFELTCVLHLIKPIHDLHSGNFSVHHTALCFLLSSGQSSWSLPPIIAFAFDRWPLFQLDKLDEFFTV